MKTIKCWYSQGPAVHWAGCPIAAKAEFTLTHGEESINLCSFHASVWRAFLEKNPSAYYQLKPMDNPEEK
jgi:hypothetical protein